MKTEKKVVEEKSISNGYTLIVANMEQKILFLGYVQAKILDSRSKISEHYNFWCTLEEKDVGIGTNIGTYPDNHPKGFKPLKNNYSFSSSAIIDYESDWVISGIKLYQFYGDKNLSQLFKNTMCMPASMDEYNRTKNYSETVDGDPRFDWQVEHDRKRIEKYNSFGATSDVIDIIFNMPYDIIELKKDLKEMEKAFKHVVGYKIPPQIPVVEPEINNCRPTWVDA